jgi:hypothetical protein
MATDDTDLSKDQLDLAKQLVLEANKSKKYRDDELDGLKKINDLNKRILESRKNQNRAEELRTALSKKNPAELQKEITAQKKLMDIAQQAVVSRQSEIHIETGKIKSIENELLTSKHIQDIRKKDLEFQLRLAKNRLIANKDDLSYLTKTQRQLLISQKEKKKDLSDIREIQSELNGLLLENTKELEEQLKKEEKIYEISKGFKQVIDNITSPISLLIGFVTLGWKRFVELDSAAKDFRNTTKLTKDQTEELTNQVESMSLEYGKFGIGVKEGYDAAAALTSQFGIMNKAVMENKNSVALLTANLGVTNENAAGFVRYMDQVGGMTKEQIANTAGFAKNLSKASGVPLDRIMEDVAHASEQARTMTGGSVINLIKASAQARKFGVDLNKVAAAARGMLDFNESINSELEASVLLGKNLSFMDARRYAFAGQLEKAQEATLNQVEKMGDFNALNVLQQEALAKASGYSVSDLQKMIKMKKDFNLLTGKEKDDYNALMKMKEVDIKNNNSARDELKKMQMQSTMDTLNNSLSTLKNSLAQLLIPILKLLTPIVEGFSIVVGSVGKLVAIFPSWVQGLAGAVTLAALLGASFFGISASISKIISMSGKLAGALSRGVVGENGPQQTGMMGKLKGWVSGKFGKTTGDISKAADGAKPKSGEAFKDFMTNFSLGVQQMDITKTFKGIAGMIALAVPVYTLGLALKSWEGISWKTIGVAAVSLVALAGAAFALGALVSGPQAAVFGAGLLALVGLGLALLPLGIAAKSAGEGMNLIGDGLGKIVPQLSTLIGMSVGLSTVTKSIIELGNAFNSFGVGSSDGLGKLLDTRVSQLQKLVDVGPQLQVTANAIKTISNPSADNSSTSTSSATSNEAVVKKLDELIGLLKSGAIAVNLDGRRVSSGLAAAVS